uniref:Uncharacterized protein n=1 Tax=Pseudo-nitzschia australis TaxID=44445 RepID=A0A7S4EQF5_9STRA|mmetsp:Transcript_21907/g.47681  ORF Transcript_21907/g.47681 Transcript_21907/m.47681 type:complete len:100 (+) Transcript_21907:57-356(+)|eukprot:CAMPEP_0168216552 /NCGR_PEP_ID=MMETSP0140_2-20121125/6701_1 /TAXON_ID=44445 /ORGANISM="Pseudo-nitzschia australis, Strain 10249 10 AB" /LENGTH=99 /DNA_ID=CAMNT_0008144101 /DNA_START=142 /DNA_END=441 /DNA_ORIENTATION=+
MIRECTNRDRIQLGLKDDNQETGQYTGRVYLSNSNNHNGGNPRPSPHQLQPRAKLRRNTQLDLNMAIKNENKHKSSPPFSYMRKLWSPSPLPPGKQDRF